MSPLSRVSKKAKSQAIPEQWRTFTSFPEDVQQKLRLLIKQLQSAESSTKE